MNQRAIQMGHQHQHQQPIESRPKKLANFRKENTQLTNANNLTTIINNAYNHPHAVHNSHGHQGMPINHLYYSQSRPSVSDYYYSNKNAANYASNSYQDDQYESNENTNYSNHHTHASKSKYSFISSYLNEYENRCRNSIQKQLKSTCF